MPVPKSVSMQALFQGGRAVRLAHKVAEGAALDLIEDGMLLIRMPAAS